MGAEALLRQTTKAEVDINSFSQLLMGLTPLCLVQPAFFSAQRVAAAEARHTTNTPQGRLALRVVQVVEFLATLMVELERVQTPIKPVWEQLLA
jgi:hypothetical protein